MYASNRVYDETGDAIAKASNFALAAHRGKVRKVGGAPYFEHVLRVGAIVAGQRGTEVEIQAALLHDVIEDAGVTMAELVDLFGLEVAHIVGEVSERKSLPFAERKLEYIDHLNTCSMSALRVAYADKLEQVMALRAHLLAEGLSGVEAYNFVDVTFKGSCEATCAFYKGVCDAVQARHFNTRLYRSELNELFKLLST